MSISGSELYRPRSLRDVTRRAWLFIRSRRRRNGDRAPSERDAGRTGSRVGPDCATQVWRNAGDVKKRSRPRRDTFPPTRSIGNEARRITRLSFPLPWHSDASVGNNCSPIKYRSHETRNVERPSRRNERYEFLLRYANFYQCGSDYNGACDCCVNDSYPKLPLVMNAPSLFLPRSDPPLSERCWRTSAIAFGNEQAEERAANGPFFNEEVIFALRISWGN